MSDDKKKLSKKDCDELCNLMKTLSTKARMQGVNTDREGYGMQESFVEQGDIDRGRKLVMEGLLRRRRRRRKLKLWRKKRRMMTCFHITCAS